MGTAADLLNYYLVRINAGQHEDPPHSNHSSPLGCECEKYGAIGGATHYSWCDAGYTNARNDGIRYASCWYNVQGYKNGSAGVWLGKPADMNQLRPGDQVFYGSSGQDHTGTVAKVDADNRRVLTYEFNIGDAARAQWRPYDGGSMSIYGFGRPPFVAATATPPEHVPVIVPVSQQATPQGELAMTSAQRNSKGLQVILLQRALKLLGYNIGRYGADGAFGGDTDAAVRKFQGDHGLKVDGGVGPKTWTALVQALLHIGIDGGYGPQTTAAVLAFQRAHPPLVPDGDTGPQTFTQLVGG